MSLRGFLKKNIPTAIIIRLRYLLFWLKNRKSLSNQKRLIKEIKTKNRIKVNFFLIHESVWKYSKLYELLDSDERFEVTVVVCPYIIYGEDNMVETMEFAYNTFVSKGYNVVASLNNGEWLDVKKELDPDLIFFTNPHNLTKIQYSIENFQDCLTAYVPYNFGNSHLYTMMYDQYFHNIVWRLYAETKIHKNYSRIYSRNMAKNVVVTGYPGVDELICNDSVDNNLYNSEKKYIIWAPHHTIDNDKSFLSFSSFLKYHDFFFEIAEKYKEEIIIIFKPHPLLKNKLYEERQWGKSRTDIYYKAWDELENGELVLGDYIEVFKISDAMIHDSGSFLIEYLYTNKPVLHTNNDDSVSQRMNSFGIMAFNNHYHAKNKNDIVDFIEMVIEGKDEMKETREDFYKKYLLPPRGRLASENIYNDLIKNLT